MRDVLSSKMLINNKIIKSLTLSDFGVWSGSSLIQVVFPLFVLSQIHGATITDIGIATLIYTSIGAIFNVPFGKFMDKKKGYVDEVYILALSNFIRGIAVIYLAFSTQLWQLYLVQAIAGLAKSMNVTSWRILFSKFVNQENLGVQWGWYDTIMSTGLGVAALLGGIMGDQFGFSIVVLVGGIMSLISTIFPLLAYKNVEKHKS